MIKAVGTPQPRRASLWCTTLQSVSQEPRWLWRLRIWHFQMPQAPLGFSSRQNQYRRSETGVVQFVASGGFSERAFIQLPTFNQKDLLQWKKTQLQLYPGGSSNFYIPQSRSYFLWTEAFPLGRRIKVHKTQKSHETRLGTPLPKVIKALINCWSGEDSLMKLSAGWAGCIRESTLGWICWWDT